MGHPQNPRPSFEPNYHEQQADYRASEADADMQRTMKTILFPLELSRQNLAITAAGQSIDAQKQTMDAEATRIQDKADRDRGYAAGAAQAQDSQGSNSSIDSGAVPAHIKGQLEAALDFQKAHIDDRATLLRKANDVSSAQYEAQVRQDNDMEDDESWADPANRKAAYLNSQLGPARRALGADFATMPTHDGRTAADWLNDKTNFAPSGRLRKPVADELTGMASDFLDKKKKAEAAAAEVERKTSDAQITADQQIRVSKEIDNGQKAEREAARKTAHDQMLRKDAEELASSQLAKNPGSMMLMGKPEGDALVAKAAAEIYKRWKAGDTAPAAAPARPTVQRAAKDGSVWEYDAETKQPIRQVKAAGS